MVIMRRLYDYSVYDKMVRINFYTEKKNIFVISDSNDILFATDMHYEPITICPYNVPKYFIDDEKNINFSGKSGKKNILTYLKLNENYIVVDAVDGSVFSYSIRVVEYNGQYFYIRGDMKDIDQKIDSNKNSTIKAMCTRDKNDAFAKLNTVTNEIIGIYRPNIETPVFYNSDASQSRIGQITLIKVKNEPNSINDVNNIEVIVFNGENTYTYREIDHDLMNKYAEEIPLRMDKLEYVKKAKYKLGHRPNNKSIDV